MFRAADRGVTATALPGIFVADAGEHYHLMVFYLQPQKLVVYYVMVCSALLQGTVRTKPSTKSRTAFVYRGKGE